MTPSAAQARGELGDPVAAELVGLGRRRAPPAPERGSRPPRRGCRSPASRAPRRRRSGPWWRRCRSSRRRGGRGPAGGGGAGSVVTGHSNAPPTRDGSARQPHRCVTVADGCGRAGAGTLAAVEYPDGAPTAVPGGAPTGDRSAADGDAGGVPALGGYRRTRPTALGPTTCATGARALGERSAPRRRHRRRTRPTRAGPGRGLRAGRPAAPADLVDGDGGRAAAPPARSLRPPARPDRPADRLPHRGRCGPVTAPTARTRCWPASPA